MLELHGIRTFIYTRWPLLLSKAYGHSASRNLSTRLDSTRLAGLVPRRRSSIWCRLEVNTLDKNTIMSYRTAIDQFSRSNRLWSERLLDSCHCSGRITRFDLICHIYATRCLLPYHSRWIYEFIQIYAHTITFRICQLSISLHPKSNPERRASCYHCLLSFNVSSYKFIFLT